MPFFPVDIEDRRVGTGLVPFDKEEFPGNFPIARWNYQQERYLRFWRHFTGEVWDEAVADKKDENGDPVLRYPLQINYARTLCMKHNYVLWGEVPDTPRPLAAVRVTPRRRAGQKLIDETTIHLADELEDFINRVWLDNSGRTLQQEGGLLQQFLGGIVYRVGWAPDDEDLEYNIRLEYVIPDFFLPVWDSGKPDYLLEAWVVWRMPTREAQLRFGYTAQSGERDPLYIEHWTKESVTITIGGKPVRYTVRAKENEEEFYYDDLPNPFGFVPFVYIPRERAGSFYGLSLLEGIDGITKEMNARLADLGDILRESAHRNLYVRNMTQTAKTTDMGGTRPAINIGVTPPGGHEPDVFAIDPVTIDNSITDYPQMLHDQLRRDTFIPPVADGEDEGSQRSGQTLYLRMWSIISKTRACRTHWTTGLIILAKMIARIAVIKGVGGITAEHLKDVDIQIDWAAMIPRDREQELNEISIAYNAKMLSPESGIRILNQVDDAQEEYRRVQEHWAWIASLQPRSAPLSDPLDGA